MENQPVREVKRENKLSFNTIENTFGLTGKITPQAVDFEEAVLGALLIDGNAISEVDFVDSVMFYKEAHQYIFRAIKELFTQGTAVDLLTVTEHLRKNKQLDFIGGPSYLAALTQRVASAANIAYHGRVVMEKYVLRELIANCTSIIKDSYDDTKDVLNLLDEAETKIFSIIQNNFKRESKNLDEVVEKAISELVSMRNQGDEFQGVPTGLRVIDEHIGGWHKSDLIILAARPGMGKTSFVLTVARNAAVDFKKPVALFSLEMSSTQLAHRLFAMESGIASERISRGKLDDAEWVRLSERIQTLNAAPLYIDDTPELSVFDLRAKCRRLKNRYDIQLIIIDYLQLMKGGDDGKNNVKGNREQEISFISRSLKQLARELNVPVIALSQLSREVEKRTGSKRPQLSDLRESGAIEQDADMVFFIYRPEVYKQETFEDETPSAGLADIQLEKNRHGSTKQDLRVRFEKQYTKFCDMDAGYSLDTPAMEGINNNTGFDMVESKMNDEDEELPY